MGDFLTIGQMCAEFNVTARALRFYETKELLFPIRMGKQRRYSKADKARLKLILQGKRFGFPLNEIRSLLDLYDLDDNQESQLKEAYRLSKIHLAEMIKRRDELNVAIHDLKEELIIVLERMNRAPVHT